MTLSEDVKLTYSTNCTAEHDPSIHCLATGCQLQLSLQYNDIPKTNVSFVECFEITELGENEKILNSDGISRGAAVYDLADRATLSYNPGSSVDITIGQYDVTDDGVVKRDLDELRYQCSFKYKWGSALLIKNAFVELPAPVGV